MAKILIAKIKSTGKEIEVYKSSTYPNKYISYDDCNTMYSESEIIIVKEKKQ